MAKKKQDIESLLKRAIETSDMTRYEISRKSGVSQTVLSFFVRGERSMTLTSAAKVAKALGLTLKPEKKKGR